MRFTIFFLSSLFGAFYASGWWAWSLFAEGDWKATILILIICTVFYVIFLIAYIDEDRRKLTRGL